MISRRTTSEESKVGNPAPGKFFSKYLKRQFFDAKLLLARVVNLNRAFDTITNGLETKFGTVIEKSQ